MGVGWEEGKGGATSCILSVEGGAARVFHPNSTILPPVDTTDGARLYPVRVGDVRDRPDDQIAGTVVQFLGRCTLGSVGLGRGVGGAMGGGGLGGGWWVCGRRPL